MVQKIKIKKGKWGGGSWCGKQLCYIKTHKMSHHYLTLDLTIFNIKYYSIRMLIFFTISKYKNMSYIYNITVFGYINKNLPRVHIFFLAVANLFFCSTYWNIYIYIYIIASLTLIILITNLIAHISYKNITIKSKQRFILNKKTYIIRNKWNEKKKRKKLEVS